MKLPVQLLTVVILLSPFGARAQNGSANDTTFVADASKNAVRIYTQAVGVQSHMFNGSEYLEYAAQGDETPYMFEDWAYGTMEYSGEYYDNVPLFYNLATDQVITVYTGGSKIQLLRPKVKYFTLEGHKFVRLDNGKVAEGFYDLKYDGNMKFYIRRVKVAATKVNGNTADAIFELRVKYYITRDDKFNSVKSKGSVMKLVKDKKKELKKYMRENKLKFGAQRESSIPKILAYYEQLQK